MTGLNHQEGYFFQCFNQLLVWFLISKRDINHLMILQRHYLLIQSILGGSPDQLASTFTPITFALKVSARWMVISNCRVGNSLTVDENRSF